VSKDIVVRIHPMTIDGVEYINVNEFALLVDKTTSSIYGMAKDEGDGSELVSTRIMNKVLISVSELSKFGKGIEDDE
jgi:hypothetical protein